MHVPSIDHGPANLGLIVHIPTLQACISISEAAFIELAELAPEDLFRS